MKNIAEQITEGLDRFYKAFQRKRVLKSLEEISATTNEDDLASATAVAALSNKLVFPDGTDFYLDVQNGVSGFNSDPARGADTFHPFFNGISFTVHWESRFYVGEQYTQLGTSNGAFRMKVSNGLATIISGTLPWHGVTYTGGNQIVKFTTHFIKFTDFSFE